MNKTILITGTSRGLGQSIFERLERPYFNLATINRTELISTKDNVFHFTGDVTNFYDLYDFVHETKKRFKTIDVVINNAGSIILKPFLEYECYDFTSIFDVNVYGPFMLSQLCIAQMLKQESGGHIINIGSTRAITGAPNKSLYSMSKFALRSLSQCINKEFKNANITSTIICPGKLDTIEKEVVDSIELLIVNDISIIPEIIIGGVI